MRILKNTYFTYVWNLLLGRKVVQELFFASEGAPFKYELRMGQNEFVN